MLAHTVSYSFYQDLPLMPITLELYGQITHKAQFKSEPVSEAMA